MIRMANWQLRVVLPTLVRVARDSPAPNAQLEVIIAELTTMAHVRGLESTLADLERENERYQTRTVQVQEKSPPKRARSRAVTSGG